ncbi:hypothetical protein Hanom_Chr05g00413821 [Helianthus anomalus]
MKDVPSIELPERALVVVGMSLHRKAGHVDKPVYVEDDKIVALYVVAYKRENGKMTTVQKGANDQPSSDVGELTNLGVGSESKKKKRASTTTTAPKKFDTLKAEVFKEEKKKGTRLVSEPSCDYVVVSDTLEGLVPVAVKKTETGASRHRGYSGRKS